MLATESFSFSPNQHPHRTSRFPPGTLSFTRHPLFLPQTVRQPASSFSACPPLSAQIPASSSEPQLLRFALFHQPPSWSRGFFQIHWTLLLQMHGPQILCSSATSPTPAGVASHSLLPAVLKLGIRSPSSSPLRHLIPSHLQGCSRRDLPSIKHCLLNRSPVFPHLDSCPRLCPAPGVPLLTSVQ